MMGFDGYGWFGGMGGFGWVFGIVMMVALVALVVWGVSALSSGRSAAGEGPLEILRRRHAAGEINKGEYEEARKTLSAR